jgi:hypothetical protein
MAFPAWMAAPSGDARGVFPGDGGPRLIRSDSCRFSELLAADYAVGERERQRLKTGGDWTRRWTVTWRVPGSDVVCPVRDLTAVPVTGCQPVRAFTWRTAQRHRPGLEFMVSTGRLHGFESIAEQRLLLALDFAADVAEIVSQPFRMRFEALDGVIAHIPDFLVVTGDGTWLIDVRPANRIEDEDRVKFAATDEIALACGWRYYVVTGWKPHVLASLDTLSSQRRPLKDPLGIQGALMAAAARRPLTFGALTEAAPYPPVARANALHLIWHRRLGIDLGRPLDNRTVIWIAGNGTHQ